MTDKELTAAAARAMGITLQWSSEETLAPRRTDTWGTFNPLQDKGDVYDLMVTLKIAVQPAGFAGGPTDRVIASHGNLRDEQLYGDNAFAATHRAIVRVAAGLADAKW